MLKKKITKIICLILVLCFVFPTAALAAPGVPQTVQYVYFQDPNSQTVIVDFIKAINDLISGNTVLYNSIKANLGIAILSGAPVYLETTVGTVLDYQKAITDNKPDLVQIQDDPLYQTSKPAFTRELRVVGGAASIEPLNIPAAPLVTNDDTANTVSGMMTGYEYSLDSMPYVLYDAVTFATVSLSGIHTLLVRVAAAGVNAAGAVTTLNFTTDAVTPPAPAVTNDDTANTVSGMLPGMEYSFDGAPYVAYNAAAFAALNFAGSHTLLVRVAAAGINPAGLITTLTFTTSVIETAEAAVSAYEAAPITSLSQITAAEALKAPADTAAAAVTDATAKAAFEARIAAKDALIAAAKTNLVGAETAAQAAAESAVATFEAAALANIANINTAAGYKTTADSKVALVGDPVAKAAFQTRITAKFIAMAIAELSLQTYAPSYDSYMAKYVTVLGINFTVYNTLANKLPVQNAMVAATFTSITDIQTTFNNAVAAQVAAEASYLTVFNTAATATDIGTAITTYAAQLGLTLTEYNALAAASKTAVQTALIGRSFTTGGEIKTAFLIAMINNTTSTQLGTLMTTNAVYLGLATTSEYTGTAKSSIEAGIIAARPIADKTKLLVVAISSNSQSGYLDQMLKYFKVSLGLDLADYEALTRRSQLTAQVDIVAATMTTKDEVQNVINTIVAPKKANEATALALFNNAVTNADIAAAISTAVATLVLYDSADYTSLGNKAAVQSSLLSQTFSSMQQVDSAWSSYTATQKASETTALTPINNATTADAMNTALLSGMVTLDLDLTELNALSPSDKAAVLLALTSPYHGTGLVLKTNLSTIIATQKVVIAINTADAAAMGSLLTTNATALGLSLTSYTSLSQASKDTVHAALVGKSFVDKVAVKAAFDAAVAIEMAIAAINNAATAAAMGTAITNYAAALGLNVVEYNSLAAASKTPVQTALLTPVFVTAADVQAALDTAVAVQKVNDAAAAAMGATLVANASKLGLNLTDYAALANKDPVHTAMTSPVFANALELKTVFDGAVALQKAAEGASSPSVMLNKEATNLIVGATETLTAMVLPSGSPSAVTWSSNNNAAATVDSNGLVTGIGAGTAIITVTAVNGGYTDTCTVTVTVPVTGITLNKANTSLYVGMTDSLVATILPANASEQTLFWTVTSSTNSATVSYDPVSGIATVTGTALGNATVYVTTKDGSFTATCQITVTHPTTVLSQMNIANETYMPGYIILYANVLGLDLTNYLALDPANQSIIQNTLIATTFTTTGQIKTVFDEAMALQEFYSATTATMGSYLTNNAAKFGLSLAVYDTLTNAEKETVHGYLMLMGYMGWFTTGADIKAAFNLAVTNAPEAVTALAGINAAAADTIGAVLASNAPILGIDMWEYDNYIDKTALDAALASQNFTNQYDLYLAIITFIYG